MTSKTSLIPVDTSAFPYFAEILNQNCVWEAKRLPTIHENVHTGDIVLVCGSDRTEIGGTVWYLYEDAAGNVGRMTRNAFKPVANSN